MLTVHVRINGPDGKPTPARVRILDASGVYRAPFGRLREFATAPGQDVGGNVLLGGERFAYIDGACEVRLPPGPVFVEVSKGPEFVPLRRTVTLGPGKISLRLALERWVDLRPEGWYAGDMRAHDLTPHAALLEGAAEGLAVVNLLARDLPSGAVPNLLAFSGTRPTLETTECAVVVNTLNAHPVLGTVGLLNCHRPVYPLRGETDNWSVADWCDQCHRKSGLATWPDLPRLTEEHPQGEALACLALGKIDAYEVCAFPDLLWYRLLDCGLRVPLIGSSGKDSNATALGAVRTYARLAPGEAFAYGPWVEAVRAGRTFVTNGPLLTLTADDEGIGSILRRSAGHVVRLRAEARSNTPIHRLELLMNGAILAATSASVIEAELPVTGSAWVAARCQGGESGQCVYAHTSAIHLQVEGAPLRPDDQALAPLLSALDRTLAWAHGSANRDEKQRQHLTETLRTGREALTRRADPKEPT